MTPALAETLAMLGEAVGGATDEWWIIGSTAVALHGRSVPHVKDVDLLMSAADAHGLLARVGGQVRAGDGDQRFRSRVFGIWTEPPLPVEIFRGFSIAIPGGWREVQLSTREAVTLGGQQLFVPSVEELVRLLHAFGRPRDMERARLLAR